MSQDKSHIDKLLRDLQERAKELNCLYRVEELLNQAAADGDLEPLFKAVVATIPEGWQYPDCCQAAILYQGKRYETPGFVETEWRQTAEIWIHDATVGEIIVSYCHEVPLSQDGVFLKEEEKLIRTIADRLAHTILHKQLKNVSQEWERMQAELAKQKGSEWIAIVDMLRKTDRQAFLYISQKMQHHLCWNGVESAEELLKTGGLSSRALMEEANSPSQRGTLDALMEWSNRVFRIAAEHFSNDHILASIQRWIQEDRSKFLMRAIDHPDSSLSDVVDAITRYQYLAADGLELPPSMGKGLAVALIRRFFSDQLEFINIAKDYLGISAYPELIKRIIFPAKSHGKLGGKSAGLILAWQMVQEKITDRKFLESIRIPRSWFVTSDAVINFLYYNNMEDIIEHKYKDRDEIILEYPNIVQLFKVSPFPPEIVKGLAAALDDLGDTPIIVRSSSLLEDRIGAAFSGKYKSLFLANQGSKQERLEALIDAIAEIYASTFGPDAIEYRRERGLLDFSEEMGILIQEVIGNRVGRSFFPSFAGVAFSNNEFRWSDRIQREDGLIRLVPGLGTRAVDRIADDYPVLMAPGKPDLRVNVSPDEVLRYSPKLMDVIDLETNRFVTREVREMLRECGDEIPAVHQMVSICEGYLITEPTSRFAINMKQDQLVTTFEGLAARTPFLKQMRALLKALEEGMGVPVDVEFAHDGKHLYLLQCRPQSYGRDNKPAPIPKDLPMDAVVFTAKRYVSNGYVPDATHIVYVDPEGYNRMGSLEALKTVGRAVGKLNEILPKRQFVLMGPGRWGSRGDVKLGVSVTYSDINNCSMLIEIAKKKGNYTPDLSFGTHFFQDLVEASIRYLPLYPDDGDVVYNERFFRGADNLLPELLPEYAHLSDTVRVIDVGKNTQGRVLRVLLNADLDEAVALLADPRISAPERDDGEESEVERHTQEDYWKWRLHMAERIAGQLDGKRFGVKGFYVFGSTKNATAGPGSDIDLLLHVDATPEQERHLLLWLEGWSLTLSEMNFLRTGYRTEGLLDVHLVTDADIEKKTSWAVKIGAITDAARPLPLKKSG